MKVEVTNKPIPQPFDILTNGCCCVGDVFEVLSVNANCSGSTNRYIGNETPYYVMICEVLQVNLTITKVLIGLTYHAGQECEFRGSGFCGVRVPYNKVKMVVENG